MGLCFCVDRFGDGLINREEARFAFSRGDGLMAKELFAVCPRCGRRAKVVSFRISWEFEEKIAQVQCLCGRSEIPYSPRRVLPVDLNNPYMREQHFDLLLPVYLGRDNLWNKIGQCLMASWREM